jgi:hypothetical protein
MRKPAPDLVSRILRMEEEIRQLRLRPPGSDPLQPWQSLYPFLTSHWQGSPGGHDASDVTDFFAPRYYLDRGRVYLNGIVLFDASAGSDAHGTIAQGAIGDLYIVEDQQSDFTFFEDTSFSNVGSVPVGDPNPPAWSRGGYIAGGGPGYFVLGMFKGNDTDDPVPDGLAISLAGVSWRVG